MDKKTVLINPNQITHRTVEPKLHNRFIVNFEEPYNVIKPWVVKGISRPVLNFRGTDITYGDMVMQLYDPINPSTTYELINVIRSQEDREKEIEFKIEMLGPINDIVEQWIIKGVIKSIDFGEMSWDNSDEQMVIEVSIQVSDATLNY